MSALEVKEISGQESDTPDWFDKYRSSFIESSDQKAQTGKSDRGAAKQKRRRSS